MRRLTHLFLKFRFTHSSFPNSRPIFETSTQSNKSRTWYWRGNSTVLNRNNRKTGLTQCPVGSFIVRWALALDACACVNADWEREWTGSEKKEIFLLSHCTLGWERRRIPVRRFFSPPPGGVLLGILRGGVPPGSPTPNLVLDQKLAFLTPLFLLCL